MIYICADDYGLCGVSDEHIDECCERGILNKISILPGLRYKNEEIKNISLHINLVEGKALSRRENVSLLTTNDGKFRYSFGNLFILSLSPKRKQLKKQLYAEIKAQISYFCSEVSPDSPIMVDSHQHTHMIPLVFKTLMKVIEDEKINVKYLRIPAEPIMPYVKTPSLYFTYSPVNLIKQWLLKILWQINKKEFKKLKISPALFMGILFSGCMDEIRVKKILPHYIRLCKKHNKDMEILFHPGFIDKEIKTETIREEFSKFYLSEGRKIEYNTVINLKKQEKEVFKSALY